MKANQSKKATETVSASEMREFREYWKPDELWDKLKWADLYPRQYEKAFSNATTDELISAIDRGLLYATPGYGESRMAEWHDANDFLSSHPHLFMGNKFDEARVYHRDRTSEIPSDLAFFCKTFFPDFPPFYKRQHELLLRETHTELRHLFNSYQTETVKRGGELHFDFLSEKGDTKRLSHKEFISKLAETVEKKDRAVFQSTVFNTLWTPPQIQRESIQAFTFGNNLIQQIKQAKIQLEDVTWRQLEEIVAELLAQRGFEIQLTKQTRDGGRDVIAVGEFFPGIKIEMAVEVAHRKKVGIEKISKALYQNRYFPKLMVATSGAFTSEVIREQNLPENRLRLILSDGNSLRDWIVSGVK